VSLTHGGADEGVVVVVEVVLEVLGMLGSSLFVGDDEWFKGAGAVTGAWVFVAHLTLCLILLLLVDSLFAYLFVFFFFLLGTSWLGSQCTKGVVDITCWNVLSIYGGGAGLLASICKGIDPKVSGGRKWGSWGTVD
jgi:hypothetical protein